MRNLILAALIAFGIGSVARADTAIPINSDGGERNHPRCRQLNVSGGSVNLLSAVAGNATIATRTITIPVADGWTDGRIQVDITEGGTITAMTVTMTCSLNGGSTYGNINTIEPGSSGAINMYAATWTKPITTSSVETFDFDASRCDSIKIVIGLTGGGASDFITAIGRLCAI